MFSPKFTTKTVAPREHRDAHRLSVHARQLKHNAHHADTLAGRQILNEYCRTKGDASDGHMVDGRTIGARREEDND